METTVRALPFADEVENPHEELLDRVFFALSDPVRRAILKRLGASPRLVSELAAPFDISLQAVSRHVQVLVQAGLVQQERSGRIARCHLEVGAMFAAAVWINEYSRYWQAQFDALAGWLRTLGRRGPGPERGVSSGRSARGPAVSRDREPTARRAQGPARRRARWPTGRPGGGPAGEGSGSTGRRPRPSGRRRP